MDRLARREGVHSPAAVEPREWGNALPLDWFEAAKVLPIAAKLISPKLERDIKRLISKGFRHNQAAFASFDRKQALRRRASQFVRPTWFFADHLAARCEPDVFLRH
jgi:hypothetical protein